MKFLNQVVIAGYIGNIGDIKATKAGSLMNFSLSFSNGKNKENKTKYAFINCTTFDDEVIEAVSAFGKKAKVLVTGRLAEDSYTNKEGKEIRQLKMIVENVCQ